jgi:DNA-binding response OmpR family regulator
MATHPIHVVLVEDDRRLAALIAEYLGGQGFSVSHEVRGDRAPERILAEQPDLVILDLMLPGLDGHAVCRAIRPHFAGPAMMLTARDEGLDQVLGLELGADDYVVKPVRPRVLLARLHALLRCADRPAASPPATEEIAFKRLRLSRRFREARLDGRPLELTDSELELLWLLASHAGEVLSRELILSRLRGIGYDGLDRSVDIAVSRLRRKLAQDPSRPVEIKTVRGAEKPSASSNRVARKP